MTTDLGHFPVEEALLISVVVPVYNGARYLAESISSILAQDYRPIEILVIDDGSTDESAAIARRFCPPGDLFPNDDVHVRYEWQQNSGAAGARNRGVELARGRFLAFLDADDLWAPDKLSRQMSVLQNDDSIDACFGMMQQFISPELDENVRATLRCPAEAMPGYTHCAMLIRSSAFMRVGFFETDWEVGEFVAWYLKALEKKLSSVMLPESVMQRRLHTSNQGMQKRGFQTDYVRILKASLDRRRQAIRRET